MEKDLYLDLLNKKLKKKMQQGNKMDIHITLGSEDGLHFLADTNLTVTSNPAYVIFILLRSKI